MGSTFAISKKPKDQIALLFTELAVFLPHPPHFSPDRIPGREADIFPDTPSRQKHLNQLTPTREQLRAITEILEVQNSL